EQPQLQPVRERKRQRGTFAQGLDNRLRALGLDQASMAVGAPNAVTREARALIQKLHAPAQTIGAHRAKTRTLGNLNRALVRRQAAQTIVARALHQRVPDGLRLRARGCAWS